MNPKISQHQSEWSILDILVVVLGVPVVVILCLAFYFIERYRRKNLKNSTDKYDYRSYISSDTGELSEPLFERKVNYKKPQKLVKLGYRSDMKRSSLDRKRAKQKSDATEEDSANEEPLRAEYYKKESVKWKTKYDQLKKTLENKQAKKLELKEDNSIVEIESGLGEDDQAKVTLDSPIYQKLKPHFDKSVISESSTLSYLFK